ncbi:MAG: GvpL/GvpF family gas vesicle protein, partial [Planctomycetota bacterium]|nr:GvpL/GvpF family gas vesicle protein [Planctomycetota bacterium]
RARTAQREVDGRLRNHAKRIIGVLSRLSEDAVLLPVRDTEHDKGMILLDLACLVKRGNMPAFASRLRKLGAGEKTNDIALSWSGPWPAYSFAGSSFHQAGDRVIG